ncbi:hypothetical protein NA57DRAFT_77185 [Rhizodiscina lignyota]|uniref:Very-long-chain 3-oxoacyl-CoA synthase n=1 Tax=Rhizodiscina lignyota TaxID=1504668 RepID=A0A9P4IFI8_9PEZI|nr:hypothetical protein NA57DRAFT_77185 [Rhizodiscina lignyota]
MESPSKVLTTFPEVFVSTIIFVIIALSIGSYVRTNGQFQYAPTLSKFNSRFYGFVSLFLLLSSLLSLPGLVDKFPYCASRWLDLSHSLGFQDVSDFARYAYHFSKFYEYLDIFNVLASGGSINFHFGFHHLTTPYFTLVRVVPASPASDGWQLFAALNTFHHILLCTYFGGGTFIRDVLPWTGYGQLLLGIAGEFWCGWKNWNNEEAWRNAFAGGILVCYLVQYRRMRQRAEGAGGEVKGD